MPSIQISSQVLAAISASLILIACGFHIGWPSPSLAKLQAKDSDILITTSQGAWIASFALIGSIFGSLLGLVLVDRWGRKTLLLLMSAPMFVSCVLIGVARSHWWLYLARFIAGIGNGGILTSIPIYMSEIAEDKVRGGLGILISAMMNIGCLVAYTVGPWASRNTLAAVGAGIPIVYAITFIWVPESPYFFAMKNHTEMTAKSLVWLRGTPDIVDEARKIRNNVMLNRKNAGTITDLFMGKGNQKALVIMIGLLTCQQVCGITAILAYSTIIFNEVDSGLSSSFFVIIMGVVKLATAISVVFLADEAGRRVLLLGSASLCIVFLLGTIILIGAGFHGAWPSPTLPLILEDTSVPVTLTQGSWIVSLHMFGCAIGPFLSIAIVDRWGRKTTMLLNSIPYFICCILIAFSQNYWWYYIARFTSGLGVGSVYTVLPMYLGEIAEDRTRGAFGFLISVMFNVGYLLPCCIGPWVSRPILAAIGGAIPIVYVLFLIWMPETPYYYVMKGKPEAARRSLEWLRGTTDINVEFTKVMENVKFDLQHAGTLKELFTKIRNQKALLIIIGLFSAQQVSGIIVVLSYSTIIFNEVSSSITSTSSVIIIGVIQLTASISIVYFADRAGRRTLLIFSTALCAIFLLGEAVYFHLKANGTDVTAISWLPITATVGYLSSYMAGIGPIPYSVMSEVFPCNIKAYATMIGMSYHSLAACVVSKWYPMVATAYGIHTAFYIFTSGCALTILLIFLYLPETRGKSFGEIQNILNGRYESREKLPKSDTLIDQPLV